jgi:hypothetical protein
VKRAEELKALGTNERRSERRGQRKALPRQRSI